MLLTNDPVSYSSDAVLTEILHCLSFTSWHVTVPWLTNVTIFSERELALYVIVRPSVFCLSVTFVHPTQAIKIFYNVSAPFAMLAIC